MTVYPKAEFADLKANVLQHMDSRYEEFMKNVLAFANKASLRERLMKSFATHGLNDVFGVSTESEIDKLVKTRNSMVHTTMYNTENTIKEEEILDYKPLCGC